jgi:hypothetical protein
MINGRFSSVDNFLFFRISPQIQEAKMTQLVKLLSLTFLDSFQRCLHPLRRAMLSALDNLWNRYTFSCLHIQIFKVLYYSTENLYLNFKKHITSTVHPFLLGTRGSKSSGRNICLHFSPPIQHHG